MYHMFCADPTNRESQRQYQGSPAIFEAKYYSRDKIASSIMSRVSQWKAWQKNVFKWDSIFPALDSLEQCYLYPDGMAIWGLHVMLGWLFADFKVNSMKEKKKKKVSLLTPRQSLSKFVQLNTSLSVLCNKFICCIGSSSVIESLYVSKALPHTYVYAGLGQRGNVWVRCCLLEECLVPAVLILQKPGKKTKKH